MNKFALIILFLAPFAKIVAQPSATIESIGPTAFCVSGKASIKITFKGGVEPYGFIMKAYRTSDNTWLATTYNLTDNPIYQSMMSDGYFLTEKNIAQGIRYELTEVFDNSEPGRDWVEGNGYKNVSGSATFKVDVMPTTDAGAIQTKVCGYQAQLQALPQYGDSQFLWDAPTSGALSANNSVNPVFTAPAEGTYTFTFNEIRGACIDQDQVDITIVGSPKATLKGESEICRSGNANAVADLEGNGPWSFTIRNADGSDSHNEFNVTSPSHTFTFGVTGNQTYTLSTLTDKNGCSAVTADLKGSAKSINLEPSVSAGIDQTVCGQLQTTLTGNTDKGNLTWITASTATFTSPNSGSTEANVTNYGTTIFTLTADNKGCTTADNVSVLFGQLPEIVLVSPETTICEGSSAQLDLTCANNGPWTVYYTQNDITETTAFDMSNGSLSFSPASTTTYQFAKITNSLGCQNTPNLPWTLTVEPIQTADAGADQSFSRQYKATLNAAPLLGNATGKWSIETPTSKAVIANSASAQTKVEQLAVGENIFKWTVTPAVCPETSDDITINVYEYTTYNGFSPNGDGINDYFVIEGANSTEKNELSVFSGKGELVYKETNYANQWNGVDTNGNPLENGTYYFVFTSQNNSPIKDYLIIKR